MKTNGYIVIETCDDYEQVLALDCDPVYPTGGVLKWRENREPCAVFGSRKAARDAITRSEHYRLAFGSRAIPEKRLCKVVPVGQV